VVLFCILNLSSLKEFIQPFIILLHLFFLLLFDGIQFDLNVTNIYIAIFLHYPSAQLCLINKGRIQLLEPLLRYLSNSTW
jgi:hypothetical protein